MYPQNAPNVRVAQMTSGHALIIYPDGRTRSVPVEEVHPADQYHPTYQLNHPYIPSPQSHRHSAYLAPTPIPAPGRPASHRPTTWHESPRHEHRRESSLPGPSSSQHGGPAKQVRYDLPERPNPLRPSRHPKHVRYNVGKLKSHRQPPPASSRGPYRYSKCTGKKRGLCIGINYNGHSDELKGCVNDANNAADFLVSHWRWHADDIMVLTDEADSRRQYPTRKNMIAGMKWLVKDAAPDDFLFFHYSGHGGQTEEAEEGSEEDGFDEVIFPLDHKSEGHIIDDELHELLVHPLPEGCKLVAVFDSCHSATALDLPYIYSPHGRLKTTGISPRACSRRESRADVISLSACKDMGKAADVYADGEAVGAMSHALMKVVRKQPIQTYDQLLANLRHYMRDRYKQVPQLCASHPIDTSRNFIS